jgi:hypothetical protein
MTMAVGGHGRGRKDMHVHLLFCCVPSAAAFTPKRRGKGGGCHNLLMAAIQHSMMPSHIFRLQQIT